MTWIIMICLMVGGAVMQTVVPSSAVIGGAKLPALLSIALYYSLTRSVTTALVAAFLAGFLHDVLSQMPLGSSVFCYCVTGWLAGYFRNMVLPDSVLITVVFGGVTNVVVTVFFYLILTQAGLVQYSCGLIFLRMLGALCLGMVCTPVIFHLAGRLDRFVGNVEMEQNLDGVE